MVLMISKFNDKNQKNAIDIKSVLFLSIYRYILSCFCLFGKDRKENKLTVFGWIYLFFSNMPILSLILILRMFRVVFFRGSSFA